MKLTAAKAPATLARPEPHVRLYVLSGGDQSSSRLHAQRLQKGLGAEKVQVTGAQLKGDPRWLVNEATSISMFGDKRLLWIEPAGEEIVPAVAALLDTAAIEAPAVAIVLAALKKDSGLKKLADTHPLVVHIASDPLTARELAAQIMELGRAEGLRVGPALAERVAEEANGDLILARLELQKFALFLNATPDDPKDLDDHVLDALGIDQSETDQARPGDLALTGDLKGLAEELVLLDASGIDPIPVVRALQRRLLMLAPLRARIEQGQRLESVLTTVWRREQPLVSRILPKWPSLRLAEALAKVQTLERELLLHPVPNKAALGETLIRLARAAVR